jgi:hypothetical protein
MANEGIGEGCRKRRQRAPSTHSTIPNDRHDGDRQKALEVDSERRAMKTKDAKLTRKETNARGIIAASETDQ